MARKALFGSTTTKHTVRRTTRSSNRQRGSSNPLDYVRHEIDDAERALDKGDFGYARHELEDARSAAVKLRERTYHPNYPNLQSGRKALFGPDDEPSRYSVGPGVYRRIEVKLHKIDPNHYDITAVRWTAGRGGDRDVISSREYRVSASEARKIARTLYEQLTRTYPNYRVELV